MIINNDDGDDNVKNTNNDDDFLGQVYNIYIYLKIYILYKIKFVIFINIF